MYSLFLFQLTNLLEDGFRDFITTLDHGNKPIDFLLPFCRFVDESSLASIYFGGNGVEGDV